MRRYFIRLLTGNTRKQTRILLISSNIWYWGEGMFGPLIAIFTKEIGGNILDIAWAWAIYLMTTGLITIIAGKMSDRLISKRRLMFIGYILNIIFTFAYLLIEVPYHLFLVQVGLGVAFACSAPTWNSLYSYYNKNRQIGYEWGLAGGQAQIYTAMGILLGGLIVQRYDFRTLFIIMGFVQIFASIIMSLLFKYPEEIFHNPEDKSNLQLTPGLSGEYNEPGI